MKYAKALAEVVALTAILPLAGLACAVYYAAWSFKDLRKP